MARHRAPTRPHRIAFAVAAALVLLVTGVAFYVLRSSEQQAKADNGPAWMTDAQKGTFDKPRSDLRCVPVGPCNIYRAEN